MAREMLLVDPTMLEFLQTKTNPPQTSQNIGTRVIQETDNDINNILSSNMSPTEQVLFYNQALQKRDQYSDKTPDNSPHQNYSDVLKSESNTNKVDPMEEEIIETIKENGFTVKAYTGSLLSIFKKYKICNKNHKNATNIIQN